MSEFGIIKIDKRSIEKIINNFGKELITDTKLIEKRMNAATNLVYATARTPRARTVTGVHHRRDTGKKYKSYVSDPSADYGVPVKTGNLRASIMKEVKKEGSEWTGHITGRVWVDTDKAPYAEYIERGTKKIAPRPFMRQAHDINQEAIERILQNKL